MDAVRLGTGIASKNLYLSVCDAVWMLQKIDLLAKDPYIRFLKIVGEASDPTHGIQWNDIPPFLGIVIHKAVVARIIRSMTRAEAMDLINSLARKQPEGPILQGGILSNEHGRLYLTANGLGWGWRLQKDKDRGFYVERYMSKRVRPVTEPKVHLSCFASLLIPISDFVDSIKRDFGSFADPYSLKALERNKREIAKYVDVPLVKPEQPTLFEQFKPQEKANG